MLVIVTERKD